MTHDRLNIEGGFDPNKPEDLLHIAERLSQIHQQLQQPVIPEDRSGAWHDPDQLYLKKPVVGSTDEVKVSPPPVFTDDQEQLDQPTRAWEPSWGSPPVRPRGVTDSRRPSSPRAEHRLRVSHLIAPSAIAGVLAVFAAVVYAHQGSSHPGIPTNHSPGTLRSVKPDAASKPSDTPNAALTTPTTVTSPGPSHSNLQPAKSGNSQPTHEEDVKKSCVGELEPKGSVDCGQTVTQTQTHNLSGSHQPLPPVSGNHSALSPASAGS